MRVLGKLSFYITCLALLAYVNAGDGDDESVSNDDSMPIEQDTSTSQTKQADSSHTSHESKETKDDDDDNDDDDDDDDNDEDSEASKDFFHSLLHPQRPRVTPINFSQRLDHFNRKDYGMWTQRAFLSARYEASDGPVLLKVGGFGEIHSEDLQELYLERLAKELHAPLYTLELRYQGRSVPTTLETENLERYCRTEQALADIERFIGFSAHAYKKWIVFGEGYGGTLAAWFRIKYPHAVAGALVFNAPLVALTQNVGRFLSTDDPGRFISNFYNDFQVLLMDRMRETVAVTLRTAFYKMGQNTDYDELKTQFNMCSKLNEGNLEDNKKFMYWSIFMYLKDILGKDGAREIVFDALVGVTGQSEVSKLIGAVDLLLQYSGEICLNVNYAEAIKKYKNVHIKYDNEINYPKPLYYGLGSRAHHFLRCTEFGLFETSNGEHSYGIELHLDFFAKLCSDVFDRKLDSSTLVQAMDNTNILYGGKNTDITHLIYLTKTDRVWQDIGFTKSKEEELIVIDYGDERSNRMKKEFRTVVNYLRKWTIVPKPALQIQEVEENINITDNQAEKQKVDDNAASTSSNESEDKTVHVENSE